MNYGIVYKTSGRKGCPKKSTIVSEEIFRTIADARNRAVSLVLDNSCIVSARVADLVVGRYVDEYRRTRDGVSNVRYGVGDVPFPLLPVRILNEFDIIFKVREATALPNPFTTFPRMFG